MTTAHRAWDSYDAYLFDIDGTLLHCTDAVHYFAFCNALTTIAGRPMNLDGVMTQGNVDEGILRDALALAGIPEYVWRPQIEQARAQMCRHAHAHRADFCMDVMPHTEELLLHLRGRGAKLGLATGNFAEIGKLKLTHCGLLQHFDFGGWSDGFEYRRDVFANAVRLAREAAGADAAVCVVGDTPSDVQAAQANGLDVIAVATGIYSFETLQAEQPTWCIRTFADLLQPTAN